MNKTFPPDTTRKHEIEFLLLNILRCVISDHSGIYISTPITSGRRLAEWSKTRDPEADLSQAETYQEFIREVITPNSEHARITIQHLSDLLPNVLVDPTVFKDVPGWNQNDYHCLWARVIETYAGKVVFLNDWQFSNGCAYEFLVANRTPSCRSILQENLEPLTLDQGIHLIELAVVELEELNLTTHFLRRVLAELTRLQTSSDLS